jgi:large subunit ribosomal protein L10
MAKTRAQKEVTLGALAENFRGASTVAFADYRGLTVAQVDDLRKQMRAADVRYMVAKKSLVTRAAKEAGYDLNAKQFDGMLGVAFGMSDEVAPAKVLGDLSKKTSVQIVGGIFGGAVVTKDKMIALSKLPSKQELLGTVVGTIYAPVSAFVRVLNAIREAREAGAPAPVAAPIAEVAPAAEAPVESAPVESSVVEAPEDKAAPAAEAPASESSTEAQA